MMKGIKVEYTVKEGFAAENKANIEKVIADLKALNAAGVMYSSWVKEDGNSFVHIFLSKEGVENPLPGLDSFKQFQAALKENVEVPPQVANLDLVGASFDL